MRLYTDNQGNWAGTQADAKKFGRFEQVEVPTDKPTLLEFLNDRRVTDFDKMLANEINSFDDFDTQEVKEAHPQSCSANHEYRDPTAYDVRDVLLNCDKKHLGSALAAIITRLYEVIEEDT